MTRTAVPIALTIAGSDSSGGAGIQADLKTFTALGVYGASVLTALTAQNTRGVQGVHPVPPAFVAAQIASVMSDLDVQAIKTGMLANAGIVDEVCTALGRRRDIPLVVDPVMVATSGDLLLDPAAVDAVAGRLLPLARVVTPNLPEAARLLGCAEAADEGEMRDQALRVLALGPEAVLLKGGHGSDAAAVDILVERGGGVTRLALPRLLSTNTHGTGCTLSAALAALLAMKVPLVEAAERAKVFVWRAMESGADLAVGSGHGPVDHLYAIRRGPPPA